MSKAAQRVLRTNPLRYLTRDARLRLGLVSLALCGASVALFVPVNALAESAAHAAAKLPAYVAHASVTGEAACAGGDTMHELAEQWARQLRQAHPRAAIRIVRQGALSADGFDQLLAGRVDCVLMVREPFASELADYRQKFKVEPLLVPVAGGSFATKSSTHAIGVFIHASNPIQQLSLVQLDAIFSGSRLVSGSEPITTWGQLGATGSWGRRPIRAYTMLRQRETGNPPGIMNFMQQRVLKGAPFRNDVIEQRDRPGETALEAIVNRIGDDPSGIGFSGFSYAKQGVKSVALSETSAGPFLIGTREEVSNRTYPLSRMIYVLVHRDKVPPAQLVLREFLRVALSREGQTAIALDRRDFLPLTTSEALISRQLVDE